MKMGMCFFKALFMSKCFFYASINMSIVGNNEEINKMEICGKEQIRNFVYFIFNAYTQ